MSKKDPEQIWSGLTDEEKHQFTKWVSDNVKCISYELSLSSVNMMVDRYDDLNFDIDEVIEKIEGGISRWRCVCEDEHYQMKDMIDHLLNNHLDDIIKEE